QVDALREEGLVGLEVLERELHLVDLGGPVEVGGDVPLRRLRLLVELDQRKPAPLIVPREDRVGVGLPRVDDGVHVGVAHRENRLEIVDLVATNQFHVAAHCDTPSPDDADANVEKRVMPGKTNASTSSRTCAGSSSRT